MLAKDKQADAWVGGCEGAPSMLVRDKQGF